MLTKNISQITHFPAFALIGEKLSAELIKELSQNDNQTLNETMTESDKEALATVECSLPSDLLKVEAKLGNLLFDCYLLGCTPPSTPMATYVAAKRAQELADLFQLEEFEIPEFAKGPIRNTLTNGKVWQKIQASATIKLSSDDKYTTLSFRGISYFNIVLNAAIESIYDPELDS